MRSTLEVIEAIKTRRSVRKFHNKAIEEPIILQVIDAARHAPSSGNIQPWEFIVIQKQETLNKLSEIHRYAWLLKDAPVAVVVVANESLSPRRYIQDCSAAIQNLLLAAHSLGLGCCWVAPEPMKDIEVDEKVKGIIPMPVDRRVVAIVAIGYPHNLLSEKYSLFGKEKKLRSFEEIVHREQW